MLNPFKAYALAADARRAEAILGEHFIGKTLAEKAYDAICLLEALRDDHRMRKAQLAAANAKIAKMQSGLRRGSKAGS